MSTRRRCVRAGVTATARVNAVNAAPPSRIVGGDVADTMMQRQLTTETDMHVYQTPRHHHHQQQQQQQATVASP